MNLRESRKYLSQCMLAIYFEEEYLKRDRIQRWQCDRFLVTRIHVFSRAESQGKKAKRLWHGQWRQYHSCGKEHPLSFTTPSYIEMTHRDLFEAERKKLKRTV